MGMLWKTLGGVVAGAVAGVVLKRVDEFIRAKQDDVEAPKSDSARRELFEPERRAVNQIDEALSLNLNSDQKQWAARGMKFVLMALFSTVSRSLRSRTTGGRGPLLGGAVFGVASYLLVDQLLEPLLGIAPSPLEQDSEDHLRGVLAHAVSGVADNVTRQLFQA
jgi:hypothetical protein